MSRVVRPPVVLEAFSPHPVVAAQAASQVSGFVRQEKDWLAETYPEVVEHYELPIPAWRNILNLARSEHARAYLVRSTGLRTATVGLARVVFDQNVIHPDLESPVEGDRIGYLLAAQSTDAMSAAVVAQLCEKQAGRPAFTTVAVGDPQAEQKAAAFREFMIAVDEPAQLTSTTPGDPFESGHASGPAQIYQFASSLLSTAA